MATIDCTLDSFKIPGLPLYEAEFGTKKADNKGLTTEECVIDTAMPFSRQRPFSVTEDSETGAVEADSRFSIAAEGVTLTLGDAAFEGCRATVANASGGSATVKGASGLNGASSGVTLADGVCLALEWRGGWRTVAATTATGALSVPGTLEVAGTATIDGVEVPVSNYDRKVNGVWHVYTVEGLLAWAAACEEDMSESCCLHNSLDMTGVEWTPVGTSENPYTGYFDGGGHCIEGLTISSSLSYVGFFGYIGSGGSCVGLHIGRTCSITGTGTRTGAVAGYAAGTVAHCSNAGTVTGGRYAGGIIGGGNCTHCVNSGTVKGAVAGGIAGVCYTLISNCDNTGTVTCSATSYTQESSGYAGGILGYGTAAVIASCANCGTVTGISSGMTGGIVGGVSTNSIITCCSNRGTAATGKYVGAIAGAKYTNCTNQYYAVSSSGSPTTVNGSTSTY